MTETKTTKTPLPRVLWGYGNEMNEEIKSGLIQPVDSQALVILIAEVKKAEEMLRSIEQTITDKLHGRAFARLASILDAKADSLALWRRDAEAVATRLDEAHAKKAARAAKAAVATK